MSRRRLLAVALVPLVVAYGYDVARNVQVRAQFLAERDAVGVTCTRHLEALGPWLVDPSGPAALCDVATDGFDAMRERTVFWRWNLGVSTPWPVSQTRRDRASRVLDAAQARCPALLAAASDAAVVPGGAEPGGKRGEDLADVARMEVDAFCSVLLPQLRASLQGPVRSAGVWEWAAIQAEAGRALDPGGGR